ncbi:MAG: hypothetical protein NVSMB52_09050 [Chloroflexota bacterium]
MPSNHKWKKNIRNVPPTVLDRVRVLRSDSVVVGCVRRVSASDLAAGMFAHLGIGVHDARPAFDPEVLPRPATGRYSGWNVVGREEVLRDAPMTTKTWSIESPNYGDWHAGSHEVEFSKDVYQRVFHPLLFSPIRIDCTGHDVRQNAFVLRFRVGRVLDRKSQDFLDDLLFDLNLLQENVGNHGVFESSASAEDYLNTLYVNWELLPPGEREENIHRILSGLKMADPKIRARIDDRYDFLAKLKPESIVQGVSGFLRHPH